MNNSPSFTGNVSLMRLTDSPLMPDFQHVLRWPVQWGDQDAYRHVNNTIYFRWFETGRMTYSADIGLDRNRLEETGLGVILPAINCHFRSALFHPDVVQIGTRVTRFGRTSMTMLHAIYSEKLRKIVADGESTVVVYQYREQAAVPIPDFVRSSIEALEGRSL